MAKADWKGMEEFQKLLNEIAKPSNLVETLESIGTRMERSTKNKIKNQNFETDGGKGKTLSDLTTSIKDKKKNLMLVDSGQLHLTITHVRKAKSVQIGSPLPYSSIHMTGGTIEPKKAKMLWIPASKEVKKALVKESIEDYIKSLRADGYNVFRTKKKGGGLGNAVFKQKKGGKMEMIFILRDSVEIPKRNFLFIDENDEKELYKIVRKTLWREKGGS